MEHASVTPGAAISLRTRRDILDWLRVENVWWAGRLSEEAFLDRIVDLDALPSTDPRYETARFDFRQHRINNNDWPDDWVFDYEPLALLSGSDERFARFLEEMLHPVIRPDTEEARSLAGEISDLMARDALEVREIGKIGNRPLWAVQRRDAPAAPIQVEPTRVPAAESTRIWTAGNLRLFLSHVSAHKLAVSRLKAAIGVFGVSAFVAHEDIEPSIEWQAEIEHALATMDALLALVTSDFHDSKWTDQEVGIALGRGKLVVAARVPENPYGFMGKLQGLPGDLAKPQLLASRVVDALLKRPETTEKMREGLVGGLETSPSFAASRDIAEKIVASGEFTQSQVARIRAASTENDQVSNAWAAMSRLGRFLAARRD